MTPPPQELIDSIVGLVDDSPTLKSCSLVATSFVAASQRRLFRSLRLYATPTHRHPHITLEGMSVFLSSTPHVSSFVHELTTPIPYLRQHAALASILCTLPHVSRLVLAEQYCEEISLELMRALKNFLPSLQCLYLLSLRSISPSFLLNAAFSVPLLSIDDSRIGVRTLADSDPALDGEATDARLRHLIISKSSSRPLGYCVLLSHPAFTAHLERLHIRVFSNSSSTYYERLLAAVAPTLTHLEWEYGVPLSLNLPNMLHVHTVELDVLIDHRGLTPRFTSTLAHIAPSLPHIRRLVLHCILRSGAGEVAWPTPDINSDTDTDAGVQFPDLRQVECRLVPHRETGVRERAVVLQDLREAMKALIPALRGTDAHMSCVYCGPRPALIDRLESRRELRRYTEKL
ncbi:hypothetical protein C8J57DRAFT_1378031 [Mycena rebaudengoi]|nr:hypothetical protein C8J57DRAFT_1378031 [Mycena rebaudengoi]